ncbi:NAD(P)-dependent oxidoreductase [Labilibacter sediminis]|nr:NAD(P)-dependent oxidoreductase [Labilibacter sediminis]
MSKNKINVLLTGASGSVGREALKMLSKEQDRFDVTVFDVKSKLSLKMLAPYKDSIEIVYGDITKEQDVKAVCLNKDVVIHLAAIIPPLADEKPRLAEAVNTQGTLHLINNLEALSPKAFFLYSSSVSVYGDRIDNPNIYVADPLQPSEGDEYAVTKIKSEEIIRNCKLDWSIFRLGAIMGNHKISNLMFHQPLATSMEIATPEDTARAFVNAIDQKHLLSKKIFNLGGGESCRISYEDFMSRSFALAGLGDAKFPEKSFAEKNFHCGYYMDGDDLEKIVHFRQDTLESYFRKEKEKIGGLQKFFTALLNKPIKKYMLKMSDPYKAYHSNDKEMINRYFK